MHEGSELKLKYGCNPSQTPARIFMADGRSLPVEVLNGQPGYINFLDALNGWQLVAELKTATGLPAAASFKHVSPTAGALGIPLSAALKRACFADGIAGLDDSPIACAYARARGADRMSSFGDWVALSDVCDGVTAELLRREVSDGIIAPGYTPEALELLRRKKRGGYSIVRIDPGYRPEPAERKQVYGVTFEQGRNETVIHAGLLKRVVTERQELPPEAVRDLLVALITLKYTQSNSVCYAVDGQAVGVGAGQQSRIHCTRLAGNKADLWHLRQHEKVLGLPFLEEMGRAERDNAVDVYLSEDAADVTGEAVWRQYFTRRPAPFERSEQREYLQTISGVSLASDAFFPFGDNIERAARSGVSFIAQPGGSVRDDLVIAACNRRKIAMAFTGMRLFHH